MARVCRNDGIGHTQKTLRHDLRHFQAVEVLQFYLLQNPLQCIFDLLRSKRAKEHRLYFCSHKEQIPPRGSDFAIKSEAIQHLHQAPVPRIGLAVQAQDLSHQWPLFDQNGADLNDWWHKSSRQVLARGQTRVSAAATTHNSETNISPPLLSSTISLNRSGFIRSPGCI